MASLTHNFVRGLGAGYLATVINIAYTAASIPLALHYLGKEQFGLYALCSSLFVSLALLDGGIRSLTRVRLASYSRTSDSTAPGRILGVGLFTFFMVCALALLVAVAIGWGGRWDRLLQLPPGGQRLLLGSGILTAFWMASVLALEPVAASGHLSRVKSANTWGVLLALPACFLCLYYRQGPWVTICTLTGCLLLSNAVLLGQSKIFCDIVLPPLPDWPRVVRETLGEGFPYYLTTVALIAKTHGLTFFISAVTGPAEAGVFYLLLRLSETVSHVAGASSETSVAGLASVPRRERPDLFAQAWAWMGLACLHGSLVVFFLLPSVWSAWLPRLTYLPCFIWPALALFGLAGAWSQMAVNASMGLGQVRSAAWVALLEFILTISGAIWGYEHGDFTGLFLGGSLAMTATLIQALRLRHILGETFLSLWWRPWKSLIPGLGISAIALYGGSILLSPKFSLLTALVPLGIILRQMLAWRRQP